MRQTRTIVMGGVATSMVAGGLAGAVLFTPGPSAAEDDDQATDLESSTEKTPPPDGSDRADRARPGPLPGGGRGLLIDTAAEVIGIEADQLRQALRDGQSIADVAEANGADVEAVADALVAAVTERIEEHLAELPDRIDALVDRQFDDRPFRGGGDKGDEGRPGFDRHGGPWFDRSDPDLEEPSAES